MAECRPRLNPRRMRESPSPLTQLKEHVICDTNAWIDWKGRWDHPGRRNECYAAKKPIQNDDDGSSGIDYLRQEYHRSLDLNVLKPYPTLSEWQAFFRRLSQLRNTVDDKIGATKSLEESKRRCLAELKTNVDGQRTNFDSVLAPPAPVVCLQDKLPNLSTASWSSSQQSPVSLGKRRIETSDCIGKHGVRPFILMGCNQCFLYVMVSDIEPKCPNCQSSLLDIFRGGRC